MRGRHKYGLVWKQLRKELADLLGLHLPFKLFECGVVPFHHVLQSVRQLKRVVSMLQDDRLVLFQRATSHALEDFLSQPGNSSTSLPHFVQHCANMDGSSQCKQPVFKLASRQKPSTYVVAISLATD